jgi:putative PIN family toxin of toxin-antitoxin system
MLRAVIDTNIFVSGLIRPGGKPAELLDRWKERDFILIVSMPVIEEIGRVLKYSKISEKYGISESDANRVTNLLTQESVVIRPCEKFDAVRKDPSDNKFIECAVAGNADFVVSGDSHLLELGTFRGIPIVGVSDFLIRLAEFR